jgi:heat shock protein HslJ
MEQTWRIATVGGQPAFGPAEVVFGADGGISGSTGCNRFSGSTRMEDGVLQIVGPLATTRMACPGDGLAAQEEAVLGVLEGRILVAYDPHTHRLDLVGGGTTLGLVPAEAPSVAPESQDDAGAGAAPRDPGPPGAGYVNVFGLSGHLNIRAEPSTGAPAVARVLAGALLRSRGCRQDGGRAWCEVTLLDAQETSGWAAAEYLEPAPAGLRAGQGVFDRIGRIPCTLAGSSPGECEAGVARDPGGTAVVVVYRTGGAERVLSFDGETFVASDASQAGGGFDATATHEGDAVVVTVDGERFEVPMSFIAGT